LFLVDQEALAVQDHQQVKAPADPMIQEYHLISDQHIKYLYPMHQM
jgi:hypothetical protein